MPQQWIWYKKPEIGVDISQKNAFRAIDKSLLGVYIPRFPILPLPAHIFVCDGVENTYSSNRS